MTVIPNYPQNLLDEHHHWHSPSDHPGSGAGRQHPFGTAGAGVEFLQFHRTFMQNFRTWYNALPFGSAPYNIAPFQNATSAQQAVAGWTTIPPEVKNGAVTGWGSVQIAQEARLSTLTPAFSSADELGNYIEGGIHGWIHGATAAAYNEPVVGTFHSPLSTYFYGIHGLVDLWWTRWEATQKHVIKDILDNKHFIKDHKEFLTEKPPKIEKFHKEFIPEKKIKEKDKDKDIFEGGFPGDIEDPRILVSQLETRLADLEIKFSQRSFIQPQERPMVGDIKHKK
jgi:hypothetical protein